MTSPMGAKTGRRRGRIRISRTTGFLLHVLGGFGLLLTLSSLGVVAMRTPWINEMHYLDTSRNSSGYFVEIAGPLSFDISGAHVCVYRTAQTAVATLLSCLTLAENAVWTADRGIGFHVTFLGNREWATEFSNAVVSLSGTSVVGDHANVWDLLCLKGPFAPTTSVTELVGGPAQGLSLADLTNVGVRETSFATLAGTSLQRLDMPACPNDDPPQASLWSGGQAQTPHALNVGQNVTVCEATATPTTTAPVTFPPTTRPTTAPVTFSPTTRPTAAPVPSSPPPPTAAPVTTTVPPSTLAPVTAVPSTAPVTTSPTAPTLPFELDELTLVLAGSTNQTTARILNNAEQEATALQICQWIQSRNSRVLQCTATITGQILQLLPNDNDLASSGFSLQLLYRLTGRLFFIGNALQIDIFRQVLVLDEAPTPEELRSFVDDLAQSTADPATRDFFQNVTVLDFFGIETTTAPTEAPTALPSRLPSLFPTRAPTDSPTLFPTTTTPTVRPTAPSLPTMLPTATCRDAASKKFLEFRRAEEPRQTRNCEWLSRQKNAVLVWYCQNARGAKTGRLVQDVCPRTCRQCVNCVDATRGEKKIDYYSFGKVSCRALATPQQRNAQCVPGSKALVRCPKSCRQCQVDV